MEYSSESNNVTELTPEGDEPLPGALLAAKEIDDVSDLLSCYTPIYIYI